MGRHEYTESDRSDYQFAMWRGRVASAIRGKRGQRLLRELRDALDALPKKELIKGDLVTEDGACCALGAVLIARETPDAHKIDSEGNNDALADMFDIAECLVQEIEYVNDEEWLGGGIALPTDVDRWASVRMWVERQIKAEVPV